MNADTRPIVGLMLGDVTGIGAEIAAKMLATQDVSALARDLGCRDLLLLENVRYEPGETRNDPVLAARQLELSSDDFDRIGRFFV